MKRSVVMGSCLVLLLIGPMQAAYAQTVCDIAGQQGGSFIGGGTTPFTVQSTGKMNCHGLNKPDTTSQLEFGASVGDNTAHCAGTNVFEYPLVNGSFVMAQANSGSTGGTPTTTLSGTFTSGASYVCFNENTSPVTTGGHFEAVISGGTGSWASATGTLVLDPADGSVLQSFGGGINQIAFTGTLGGNIQHP